MSNSNVTRGNDLLEVFLSKQRCLMSNKLIPDDYRRGRILDIGCGSHPLNLINTRFSEKYGLDKFIDDNYKNNLELKEISFYNFDMEKNNTLPFEDNFFDVITMLAVFEHIEQNKLSVLIKEIKRILKPNGLYILTVPAYWTDKTLRTLAKLGLVSKEEVEEHKDSYTHKKIFYYLNEGGFNDKDLQGGYFEFFMNLWVTAKKNV